MMRTSNPALNAAVFSVRDTSCSTVMTLQGTVAKTAILLGILMVGAAFTWHQAMQGYDVANVANVRPGSVQLSQVPPGIMGYIAGGAIVGMILALITVFKPAVSPYTAPVYALAEGVFLGGFSAMFQYIYPGIVPEAVALTFGTFAALLTAYATRIIRPTEKFKLGIVAATGGICLFYLATMVLGFFGVGIPAIYQAGWVGIGFSAFVVVIAALNLVLDFDFIETGCAQGAPKYMEWYGGFGLLVTLVWLYMEILRLLVKLRGRD
ncbi:MAG TPA: Bax inhibitor-1/YccA family protein [Pirellulales bacterium]